MLLATSSIVLPTTFRVAAARSDADRLEYRDFTTLYENRKLPAALKAKLDRLLSATFVSNAALTAPPVIASSDRLGQYIRVAHWNIEQGLEFEALAAVFESEAALESRLDPGRFPLGSADRERIIEQARALRAADVIVLNEVDWGLPRSDYRNIAAELAEKLGMSYAFAVEFVELSPAVSPRLEVDPERYYGLHGTAILSRFPLRNVRMSRFRHQPYDWFETEKKGVDIVEKARQKLAYTIFQTTTLTEVRRGGRMMLAAEITDTRFPAGRATIVATHLENRSKPAGRQQQLAEMLEAISDIRGPVVVCGDMNTSSGDASPTSLQRELKKRLGHPEALLKTGANYVLGLGIIENAALASLLFGRNYADPTVRSIPFLMPNDERKFFSMLKAFRFADKGAFDFRGSADRSANGRRNTLANSNEREKKGFVTTFRLQRPIKVVGKYKLDWIFVKPVHLFDPSDYDGSYLFAPHFGRVLGEVNRLIPDRISDHSPMIVDLPLLEPSISKQKSKK